MHTWTGTACDPICCYCGRPIVGVLVWGASGPYHPACVNAVNYWGESDLSNEAKTPPPGQAPKNVKTAP
jgi:hypothetical protein